MASEEVKFSVEEWLHIGAMSNKLLLKNTPIKLELDKTLENISKIQKSFITEQKVLLDKYVEKSDDGVFITKVPGADDSKIENLLFKDEKKFQEKLEILLSKEVSVPMYKIEGNLEYPYNGVIITLRKYLEINTDLPALDCIFLLEYYIK